MRETTVVFVHGFRSSPECWNPFVKRLQKDADFGQAYRFTHFQYPTKFGERNLLKRIPGIDECGKYLGSFLDGQPEFEQLFLVGHSMGGLVIQSFLAQKIRSHRATDLAKIRSVILFATPNRGTTKLNWLRGICSKFFGNPQEVGLRVLDKDVAEISELITKNILTAESADKMCCPIPFQVFWGLQDDVVPEVSARSSFVEVDPLPGGHNDIIKCDPGDPYGEERYQALKNALLSPVGHPSTYEIDLFEIKLVVSPVGPEKTFTLRGDVKPFTIQTDNVATRTTTITFSKQNRCSIPYRQVYETENGYVELFNLTPPNDASDLDKSAYYKKGQRFTYVFTPDRGKTFSMTLRIYNGFAEEQRNWHNHMKANAHYRLFRVILNLEDYQNAGYEISQDPSMYFYAQNIVDHDLCKHRDIGTPLPHLPSSGPWLRTWQIANVKGGVVDLIWNVKKPV